MSKSKTLLSSQAFHEVPSTREEIKKIISQKSIPELFWVLTGKAGSGKTLVMENLASQDVYPLHSSRLIDKHICTQLLFEALLAKELFQTPLRFLVEDKGRKIAHLSIPEKLLTAWDLAPHFLVEAPLELRVENIFNQHVSTKSGPLEQLAFLEQGKERMGESLYRKLRKFCEAAALDNDVELHKEWIRLLIIEHLDPAFDHYFHHKNSKIQFKGSLNDVTSYLKNEAEKIKAIVLDLEASNKSENKLEKDLEKEA